MKTYTTYIFDLDGTITDTLMVWLEIFRDNLTHFGITPPDDRTLAKHTHDWAQMVELGLPAEQVEAFAERAHGLANARLPQADLHVGAYEMLEALKNQGKKIAIFSTMDRPMFDPAVKHRNLDMITNVLIAGTDVARRKPHPDGILKALKDLGVPESEYGTAVYIGDKDTDIQAAHNAGIDGILYYPAGHQLTYDLAELQKHDPEAILTDWEQLLADKSRS